LGAILDVSGFFLKGLPLAFFPSPQCQSLRPVIGILADRHVHPIVNHFCPDVSFLLFSSRPPVFFFPEPLLAASHFCQSCKPKHRLPNPRSLPVRFPSPPCPLNTVSYLPGLISILSIRENCACGIGILISYVPQVLLERTPCPRRQGFSDGKNPRKITVDRPEPGVTFFPLPPPALCGLFVAKKVLGGGIMF